MIEYSYPYMPSIHMIRILFSLLLLILPKLLCAEPLVLSDSERAWLKAHPVVRIGIDAGYAPYSYVDEDGQFIGVAPDILSLVASRLGIRFEAVPGLSWPEIVSGARDRELDVIATAVSTPERETFLDFTRIYIPTPLVMMTRYDDARIHRPGDLANHKIALVKGYSSSERVIKEHPNIIVLDVETALEGLRAVATNEADAYVGVLGINVHLASIHGITNLKVAGRYDVETNGQRLAVRNDWPELANILDKTLASIPETEIISIVQKWAPITSDSASETVKARFLNADEQAFVAAHPVIRVANEMDWPPFDFVDKYSRPAGYSIDYFSLAAKKAGLGIEWVNGEGWTTLLQYGRERKIDAFPAIVESVERSRFLTFTKVYQENVPSFFVREDSSINTISSETELVPYRLAMVKGYADYQSVKKYFPKVDVLAVDSVLEGLKAVLTGDADIFVGDTSVCNYIIKENSLRNLRRAGSVNIPELQRNTGLRFASRSDWPILSSILNKAMAEVTEEELRTLRGRWLELPRPPLLTNERIVMFIVFVVMLAILLSVFWNISLRRQRANLTRVLGEQNKMLFESEKRLALALQSGGMVAWDTDYQTGTTVVSNGFWDIVEISEEPGVNAWHCLQQLIHEEDYDLVKQAESEYLSGKTEKYQVEYRITRKDGSTRWLVNQGAAVELDEDGHPQRIVGIIHDITENKHLERMKDEFVSSISHELRTPLTSIKGSLALALNGVLGEMPVKVKEMVSIAFDNTDRLILLVNDILDIEKLLAGEMVFERDKLVIGALIAKAVTANQGYADQYGVGFSIDMNNASECVVIADENRLLQVLSNLLSNAIKYSPQGSAISIKTHYSGQKVRITVSDEGEGVPEEFRERIFSRFSQADSSSSRKKGGTGLGLAISREIVEQHDGTLGFVSPPGEGASFYFELDVSQ